VLVKVLDDSLRLLHPYIPFVTEETWGYLRRAAGQEESWPAALIVAPWPEPAGTDPAAEADMAQIMEIVRVVRNARAEYNVTPGKRIAAAVAAGPATSLIRAQARVICTLARLDEAQLSVAEAGSAPAQSLTLVAGSVTVYLPLADLVDLAAERQRLTRELAETQGQLERSKKLLAGPFGQRAPAGVVEREREKLGELKARAERLQARLADLE
jgi:valyl-tRNA synthetase